MAWHVGNKDDLFFLKGGSVILGIKQHVHLRKRRLPCAGVFRDRLSLGMGVGGGVLWTPLSNYNFILCTDASPDVTINPFGV